jgi:hypothetical protein
VPAAKRQRVPGAEGEQDDNGQLSDAAMLGGFDNYDEDDEMMGVGGGGGGGFDEFDDDDDDAAAGGMFANNAAIVDDKSGLVASPLSNMFFCAFFDVHYSLLTLAFHRTTKVQDWICYESTSSRCQVVEKVDLARVGATCQRR